MALDANIKGQLKQLLALLESDLVLKVSVGDDKVSKETLELVNELAELSPRITVEHTQLERTPSFSINKAGSEESGVVFAGVPLGHEFNSLVLALLQVSGRAPKSRRYND
jgi:Alkyl hydroperoxide reductase, large subunit